MLIIPQFSFPYRASLVSGPGGMVILVLFIAGFIHAIIAMAFCYAAAFAATLALIAADKTLRWNASFRFKGLFQTMTSAFVAFVVVTWIVDLLAQSYLSPPMMVIALGRAVCWPDCAIYGYTGVPMAVTSIPTYYGFAAGAGTLDPVRYLLLAAPGAIAIAVMLRLTHPSVFAGDTVHNFDMKQHGTWSFAIDNQVFVGPAGLPRLAIASLLSTAVALFVVTPPFIGLLLAWASLIR
jgi:hypothetical protein